MQGYRIVSAILPCVQISPRGSRRNHTVVGHSGAVLLSSSSVGAPKKGKKGRLVHVSISPNLLHRIGISHYAHKTMVGMTLSPVALG
jgi:hypothetical protein